MCRFVDFIQVQYKQDFEQFLGTIKQSDANPIGMGHKSLKLVYYRQNDKVRAQTYLDVEHSLTIAETEKIDQKYTQMQKDNQELCGIVDNLSR